MEVYYTITVTTLKLPFSFERLITSCPLHVRFLRFVYDTRRKSISRADAFGTRFKGVRYSFSNIDMICIILSRLRRYHAIDTTQTHVIQWGFGGSNRNSQEILFRFSFARIQNSAACVRVIFISYR